MLPLQNTTSIWEDESALRSGHFNSGLLGRETKLLSVLISAAVFALNKQRSLL